MARRGGRSAELALPAQPSAPAQARRFVVATLDGWGVAGGDDVVLLVSELATNALLHARTEMTVRISEDGPSAILLSVSDSSGEVPRARPASVDSATGRGLTLVTRIADTWGVETYQGGKTVWCRVRLDGAPAYGAFDVDAVELL